MITTCDPHYAYAQSWHMTIIWCECDVMAQSSNRYNQKLPFTINCLYFLRKKIAATQRGLQNSAQNSSWVDHTCLKKEWNIPRSIPTLSFVKQIWQKKGREGFAAPFFSWQSQMLSLTLPFLKYWIHRRHKLTFETPNWLLKRRIDFWNARSTFETPNRLLKCQIDFSNAKLTFQTPKSCVALLIP